MISLEEIQPRFTLNDIFELLKRVESDHVNAKKQREESLDALFAIFYNAKIAEGRSERTLEQYRENYRYFCEFLLSNGIALEIGQITPTVIRKYITWLLKDKKKWNNHSHKPDKYQTKGLSPVTINTRLKGLRTMFRFLHMEKLIDTNPISQVKKVREFEPEINILSINHLRKLIRTPDRSTYSGYRDFVILLFKIETFCRIGELISIKKSDVDFEKGMILLRSETTKTRRSRVVPVQEYTLSKLKKLIDYTSKKSRSEYVFQSVHGEQIKANNFRHRLKKYATMAGINLRTYPYILRHTGATLFLEGSGNTRLLQMLLGHVDPRQVLRYTHLSSKYIKAEHEKHSPLNHLIQK